MYSGIAMGKFVRDLPEHDGYVISLFKHPRKVGDRYYDFLFAVRFSQRQRDLLDATISKGYTIKVYFEDLGIPPRDLLDAEPEVEVMIYCHHVIL